MKVEFEKLTITFDETNRIAGINGIVSNRIGLSDNHIEGIGKAILNKLTSCEDNEDVSLNGNRLNGSQRVL